MLSVCLRRRLFTSPSGGLLLDLKQLSYNKSAFDFWNKQHVAVLNAPLYPLPICHVCSSLMQVLLCLCTGPQSGDADWSPCTSEYHGRLQLLHRPPNYHSCIKTPIMVLFAAALAPTTRKESAMTSRAAAMTHAVERQCCLKYGQVPRSGYFPFTTCPAETSHDFLCVLLSSSFPISSIQFDMLLVSSVISLQLS